MMKVLELDPDHPARENINMLCEPKKILEALGQASHIIMRVHLKSK
jgi:hypothetical protein